MWKVYNGWNRSTDNWDSPSKQPKSELAKADSQRGADKVPAKTKPKLKPAAKAQAADQDVKGKKAAPAATKPATKKTAAASRPKATAPKTKPECTVPWRPVPWSSRSFIKISTAFAFCKTSNSVAFIDKCLIAFNMCTRYSDCRSSQAWRKPRWHITS